MPQLAAPSGLVIWYEPEYNILRARWLEEQPLPVLQASYMALLNAAQTVGGACHWLLDMRNRGITPPHIAVWVMQTLLPQLAPALGATPHLAYLNSPVQAAWVREMEVAPPEPSYFEANFWLGVFLDEGEAREWLRQQQRRTGLPGTRPLPDSLSSPLS